jgi:excisionase family DNA binding protein
MAKNESSAVSVADAGHLLGVSRSTIWRMIRRGDLPSIRQGGRRLVLADALRASSTRTLKNSVPPLSKDHPIFRLAGAGRSGRNPPGASDKHAILDQ